MRKTFEFGTKAAFAMLFTAFFFTAKPASAALFDLDYRNLTVNPQVATNPTAQTPVPINGATLSGGGGGTGRSLTVRKAGGDAVANKGKKSAGGKK